MGEFIELIGQLKPKNNNDFPIADVNDLIGGYIQCKTVEELNSHNSSKLRVGMLAYIQSTNNIYQYVGGIWQLWTGGQGGGSGASIIKVDNLEDLNNPELKILGQIVFVDEIKDLRYYDGSVWKSFTRIYIQPTPPEDMGAIWIDNSDEKPFVSEGGVINSLVQAIGILQEEIRRLKWTLNNQLDFGDFNNNHYSEYDDYEDPVEPFLGSDPEEDLEELIENLNSETGEVEPEQYKTMLPNGKHLSIKGGTYKQMVENADNFLPNELLWCEDTQQLWIKDKRTNRLIQIGASGGGTPPEIDDKIMDQILTELVGSDEKIVGIEFGDMNNLDLTYRLSVKDGKLDLYDYRLDKNTLSGNNQSVSSGSYYSKPYFPILSDNTGNSNSPMIYIQSFYLGGDKDDYNPVSHNFVELTNLANVDLNLKGLYLHYTERNTGQWVTLPLKGVIKSKQTFLIRGTQSSVIDINTTYIQVETYDMEWTKDLTYNSDVLRVEDHDIWDEKGLIKFSNSCSFYLSGAESDDHFIVNPLVDNAPWNELGVKKWYVDLVGIGSYEGTRLPAEKSPIPSVGQNYLYHMKFSMDSVQQVIKGVTARNNSTEYLAINFDKYNDRVDYTVYTPKASFEHKNLFYNKTSVRPGAPNFVNCSFGQDAHVTRCFNWMSRGYYDEYIWFAYEKGVYLEENKFESFKSGDGRTSNKNWNDPIYDRIRNIATDGTAFTVHKFIKDWNEVDEPTTIYYKVGREGAWTEEHSFTLRNRNSVKKSNNFLHISDSQGHIKEEYETWRISADFIKEHETNYDWILNTGDISQNGNRFSEWLDYFDFGKNLFKDKEHMFTIGNNDLSPKNNRELGGGNDLSKINAENMLLYFTNEHPYEIPRSETGKYIPSVYSFVYGDTYYLSMNSEISTLSRELIFEDPTGVNIYKDTLKNWAERDLAYYAQDVKWRVAFCHESPFTILTANKIMEYAKPSGESYVVNPNAERGGSRLNTLGEYWFSKYMEDNGFSLCLCGHKHTYSNSRYLKDDKDMTMAPIVYDPEYNPDTDTYPQWYKDLPEREKLCVRLSNDPSEGFVKYVMMQATGSKLISNKELPAQNIPWLQEYYPVVSQVENYVNNTASVTVNSAQRFSHYIIWNFGEGNEGESGVVSNVRDRIKGEVYKLVLKDNPTQLWEYKYNNPIEVKDLTKVGGNGSVNPTNNIIVEKLT